MRLHLGAIPSDPLAEPAPPWRQIREPGPFLFQFGALPLGLLAMVAVGWGWSQVTALSMSSSDLQGGLGWFMPAMLLSIPGIVVIHELLHAAVHPQGGRTSRSIIGLWPSRLLFYAHYEGEISCCRFLTILAMPFLVITIAPLLLAVVFKPSGSMAVFAAWCSIWNALLACGDLFALALVGSQVPGRARVRNHGWKTFWRRDDPAT